MKIPETSANVGAYYGNEENGQWQPNGVIIDSGVGGGVVGSGDAGIHRPPVYPVHIPRGHMPGYVMAGAYYPPAAFPPVPAPPPDDFADYMWMENEEEFDKQVMQQLEEEALMEQCIEAMLEDEQRERQQSNVTNGHKQQGPTTSNGNPNLSLEETVSRSTLNPLAAEFVPTGARRPAPPPPPPAGDQTQERQEDTESPSTHEPQKSREEVQSPAEQPATVDLKSEVTEEPQTEEPVPPPKDPPEVSAADVQPIADKPQEKKQKDIRKEFNLNIKPRIDTKKPVKTEVKLKPKPQIAKSETKVQPKKKEVKSVRSDTKVEENVDDVIVPIVDLPKPQPTPVAEETTQVPSGPKPINYAAAAKANKPKKPTTPPATDKSTPPPLKNEKLKTTDKLEKKDKLKTEKPVKIEKANVQRKNSTK